MSTAILHFNWQRMALILALPLWFSGCGTLRQPADTPPTAAVAPVSGGALAETSRALRNSKGESAFQLLEDNHEALEWRLALADHATKSIDAQYFIWQNDESATLLFLRLLEAADRGVRVRLLVDDLSLAAKDKSLASLSQHPNLEIRLFNPNAARSGWLRPIGNFLLNFRQLNRRMHNKLFVADNRMGIVGGRNIGNEYFGLSEKYNFRDMDVLVAGPVVSEISSAFDEYWNHETAVPSSVLSKKGSLEHVKKIRTEGEAFLEANSAVLASYPLERKDWRPELRAFVRDAHRGEAHFLQDDPVKVGSGEEVRLVDMIDYIAAPSHEELLVVSPYTIPVGDFLKSLNRLTDDGVRVKIVTGSMESNNHTIAHSHYKKYRGPLLDAGVDLKEFRGWPEKGQRELTDVDPVEAKFVAIHVKTLVGDRQRCFIGSLNLDPRAVVINTENGLLIESPELASELADQIELMAAPENSWTVSRDEKGRLLWTSSAGEQRIQPARSGSQRLADFFFQLLPIESQL